MLDGSGFRRENTATSVHLMQETLAIQITLPSKLSIDDFVLPSGINKLEAITISDKIASPKTMQLPVQYLLPITGTITAPLQFSINNSETYSRPNLTYSFSNSLFYHSRTSSASYAANDDYNFQTKSITSPAVYGAKTLPYILFSPPQEINSKYVGNMAYFASRIFAPPKYLAPQPSVSDIPVQQLEIKIVSNLINSQAKTEIQHYQATPQNLSYSTSVQNVKITNNAAQPQTYSNSTAKNYSAPAKIESNFYHQATQPQISSNALQTKPVNHSKSLDDLLQQTPSVSSEMPAVYHLEIQASLPNQYNRQKFPEKAPTLEARFEQPHQNTIQYSNNSGQNAFTYSAAQSNYVNKQIPIVNNTATTAYFNGNLLLQINSKQQSPSRKYTRAKPAVKYKQSDTAEEKQEPKATEEKYTEKEKQIEYESAEPTPDKKPAKAKIPDTAQKTENYDGKQEKKETYSQDSAAIAVGYAGAAVAGIAAMGLAGAASGIASLFGKRDKNSDYKEPEKQYAETPITTEILVSIPVVQQNSAAFDKKLINDLESILSSVESELGYENASVSIYNTKTGAYHGRKDKTPLPAPSLNKVAIIYAAHYLAQQGMLDLSDNNKVKNYDSGIRQKEVKQYKQFDDLNAEFTPSQLRPLIIRDSVNHATNLYLKLIGKGDIENGKRTVNDTMQQIGLGDINVTHYDVDGEYLNGKTSAKSMNKLLGYILKDKHFGGEYSRQIKEDMENERHTPLKQFLHGTTAGTKYTAYKNGTGFTGYFGDYIATVMFSGSKDNLYADNTNNAGEIKRKSTAAGMQSNNKIQEISKLFGSQLFGIEYGTQKAA